MIWGVLLHGARTRLGVWPGVLLSATVFGSIHVLNGLVTGLWWVAVIQAFLAGLYGVWSGALRVRTESILPVIAIHFLWDGLLVLGGEGIALIALPFAFVLAGYGAWLLRSYVRLAPPSAPEAAPWPSAPMSLGPDTLGPPMAPTPPSAPPGVPTPPSVPGPGPG